MILIGKEKEVSGSSSPRYEVGFVRERFTLNVKLSGTNLYLVGIQYEYRTPNKKKIGKQKGTNYD